MHNTIRGLTGRGCTKFHSNKTIELIHCVGHRRHPLPARPLGALPLNKHWRGAAAIAMAWSLISDSRFLRWDHQKYSFPLVYREVPPPPDAPPPFPLGSIGRRCHRSRYRRRGCPPCGPRGLPGTGAQAYRAGPAGTPAALWGASGPESQEASGARWDAGQGSEDREGALESPESPKVRKVREPGYCRPTIPEGSRCPKCKKRIDYNVRKLRYGRRDKNRSHSVCDGMCLIKQMERKVDVRVAGRRLFTGPRTGSSVVASASTHVAPSRRVRTPAAFALDDPEEQQEQQRVDDDHGEARGDKAMNSSHPDMTVEEVCLCI